MHAKSPLIQQSLIVEASSHTFAFAACSIQKQMLSSKAASDLLRILVFIDAALANRCPGITQKVQTTALASPFLHVPWLVRWVKLVRV